jgi:hypothetical protein
MSLAVGIPVCMGLSLVRNLLKGLIKHEKQGTS